jgi:hypothetical protein
MSFVRRTENPAQNAIDITARLTRRDAVAMSSRQLADWHDGLALLLAAMSPDDRFDSDGQSADQSDRIALVKLDEEFRALMDGPE